MRCAKKGCGRIAVSRVFFKNILIMVCRPHDNEYIRKGAKTRKLPKERKHNLWWTLGELEGREQ